MRGADVCVTAAAYEGKYTLHAKGAVGWRCRVESVHKAKGNGKRTIKIFGDHYFDLDDSEYILPIKQQRTSAVSTRARGRKATSAEVDEEREEQEECEATVIEKVRDEIKKMSADERRQELEQRGGEEAGVGRKTVLGDRLFIYRYEELMQKPWEELPFPPSAAAEERARAERCERAANRIEQRDKAETEERVQGSTGSRSIEMTSWLSPLAMRRLLLAPGRTPPWLLPDCDFDAIARSEGPIDVLDEEVKEWDPTFRRVMEPPKERKECGERPNQNARRRARKQAAARANTMGSS